VTGARGRAATPLWGYVPRRAGGRRPIRFPLSLEAQPFKILDYEIVAEARRTSRSSGRFCSWHAGCRDISSLLVNSKHSKRGITVEYVLRTSLVLLAQEGGGEAGNPPGGGLMSLLFPMLAIGFLFYFLLIRPQRRQQAQREAMLGEIKKNDRVITAGGVYGTVANVHREADEVTLKVDEATNTKIRVTFGSITRVLGDETSSEPSK